MPGANYRLAVYTAWQSAKKAVIGTVVVSVLFIWVLDTAIQLEQDTYYGGEWVIVLFFAGLGSRNVIWLFGALITIGIIAVIRKMTNRPVKHIIELKR